MHIGERLKAVRIARGLTQKEVADKTGTDPGIIGKAERTTNITSVLLKKLCIVYNVPPSYILDLVDGEFDLEARWASLIKLCDKNSITPRDAWFIIKYHVDQTEKIKEKLKGEY